MSKLFFVFPDAASGKFVVVESGEAQRPSLVKHKVPIFKHKKKADEVCTYFNLLMTKYGEVKENGQ